MEVVTSLTNRCASLEDIIRQQEQTLTALLGRVREMEQFVGSEARNREQAQRQISELYADRSNSAHTSDKLGTMIQGIQDRVNSLQSEGQAQRGAIQLLDQKCDTAFHSLEVKLQGDIGTCQQRMQAAEGANAEAFRTVQGSLQSQAQAVQQVDARAREALQALQGQTGSDAVTLRQRVEMLEGAVRDTLQQVHGGLSDDIKNTADQLQQQVRQQLRTHSEALTALDQRVRQDLQQLHQQGQNDNGVSLRRIDELAKTARDAMQASHATLSAEIANVAQHSQAVDTRQQTAHQALIQELSKHDQQMETIDVSWRASVMDLNGKVDTNIASARTQTLTGDQQLQAQIAELQERLTLTTERMNGDINELARGVQERCILPLERVHSTIARQAEQLARLTEEGEKVREFLRVFAQEVDRNASQFRQVMEAAVRAAHSDLTDRINIVAASVSMRQDANDVHAQINQALTKIWGDVSTTFVTHRDLHGIQSQIANLESAVRVEICVLAEKDNDLHRRIDTIQVPFRVVEPRSGLTAGAGNEDRISDHGSSAASSVGATTSAEQQNVSDAYKGDKREISTRSLLGKDINSGAAATGDGVDDRNAVRHSADEYAGAASSLDAGKQARDTSDVRAMALEVEHLKRQVAQQRGDIEVLMSRMRRTSSTFAAGTPSRATGRGRSSIDAAASSGALVPYSGVSSPSNDNIRRVSGLTKGGEFIVRDTDTPVTPGQQVIFRAPSEDGNESATSFHTTEGGAGRRGSAEVLLPTHQFVRKKEYSNFKDFTKQEIDSLWVEVLGLRRNKGMTKEEVQLLLSQSKEVMLRELLDIIAKNENDVMGMLSAIRLQVNEMGKRPVMTELKIFPAHEGTVNVEDLVREIAHPSESSGAVPQLQPYAVYTGEGIDRSRSTALMPGESRQPELQQTKITGPLSSTQPNAFSTPGSSIAEKPLSVGYIPPFVQRHTSNSQEPVLMHADGTANPARPLGTNASGLVSSADRDRSGSGTVKDLAARASSLTKEIEKLSRLEDALASSNARVSSGEPTRNSYLSESRSGPPRNSVGGSYHLEPLKGASQQYTPDHNFAVKGVQEQQQQRSVASGDKQKKQQRPQTSSTISSRSPSSSSMSSTSSSSSSFDNYHRQATGSSSRRRTQQQQGDRRGNRSGSGSGRRARRVSAEELDSLIHERGSSANRRSSPSSQYQDPSSSSSRDHVYKSTAAPSSSRHSNDNSIWSHGEGASSGSPLPLRHPHRLSVPGVKADTSTPLRTLPSSEGVRVSVFVDSDRASVGARSGASLPTGVNSSDARAHKETFVTPTSETAHLYAPRVVVSGGEDLYNPHPSPEHYTSTPGNNPSMRSSNNKSNSPSGAAAHRYDEM